MAQAQGSLSSAVHAVEGVPLPSNHGPNSVIENLWRNQVASRGGFVRRPILHTCGLFTTCLQIPPPPGPEYPPSTLERFGVLLLALILIFALALLVLPEKWSRTVIKIAFCIGPKGRP